MQDFNPRSVRSMRIAKVILQETGTYNPLFNRPYQTHVNDVTMDETIRRIDEFDRQAITGKMLVGIAGNILKPSATPGSEIAIPNGWNERRIRFVIEVHVEFSTGSTMLYYLQGYTDYPGVTLQGAVAPDMQFIVNSIIGVSRTTIPTPAGMQTRDIVSESSQLLADNFGGYGGFQQQQFSMRPQDVFNGIQSQYLSSYTENPGNIMDTRSMIRREPLRSTRSNNVAASFMARVLDANQMGHQLSQYGQDDRDILSQSRFHVAEPPIHENIVIRTLSEMTGSFAKNRFTFSEFERLDPNVCNVTNYHAPGAMMQVSNHLPVHQTGATEYWTGSDIVTQTATVLSNAVPALMMDLLISNVTFMSTNHTIGCVQDTRLVNAISLSSADMRQNYEVFRRRVESELLFDLTFGNQEAYTLNMTCDMFGETWIELSFAGYPSTQFVVPSFCDTLYAPVVTSNKDSFDVLVNDFNTLLGAVNETGARHGLTGVDFTYNKGI